MTPFPISAVSGQPWSIPLVVSAIRGERQKEYYPISGIPKAVRSLQERVYPSMSSKRRDVVEHQSWLCEIGIDLLSGRITAGDYFVSLCGDLGIDRGDQEESSYSAMTYLILARQFEASLVRPDVSIFRIYADLEHSFVKERRSLLWPEFETSYPITANLSHMSKTMFRLETRLADPMGQSEDWKLMIKGMHNPFDPESFGLKTFQRTAKVSHRLGLQVQKISRSPEEIGKLLKGSRRRPFTDSNVVLHYRTPGGGWGRRGYVPDDD